MAKIKVPPTATPTAIPSTKKAKKAKKDSETKMISFELSSQWRMSARKMKKEQMPKLESEEEEEFFAEDTGSFDGDLESEEEDEIATPPPEKRKKIEMQSSDRKKLTSTFKTLIPPKRPTKTPQKGESSQKRQKK